MCGSTRLLFRFLPKSGQRFCAAIQARATSGLWQCRIPAYEMIRFSVNIMRGCFGAALSVLSPSTKGALFRAVPKFDH